MNVRDAVIEMLEDPTLPPVDREPRGPVGPSAVDRFQHEWGLSMPLAVREWLAARNGAFIGHQVALGIETGGVWDIEATLRDSRCGIYAAGSRWQRMEVGTTTSPLRPRAVSPRV